ncbi:MAG: hypothetical protein IPG39_13665 [Bacteroidetes bacterium]|nr:hypothetical protein [Bacteroidota bacterium]
MGRLFCNKTDSIGNVEWSKKLVQGNEIDPPDIIATNDSGFYFMSNQLDGWVGLFNVPTISKVDKYGNIVKSRLITIINLGLMAIKLHFVKLIL